jgi:hypothetical protein
MYLSQKLNKTATLQSFLKQLNHPRNSLNEVGICQKDWGKSTVLSLDIYMTGGMNTACIPNVTFDCDKSCYKIIEKSNYWKKRLDNLRATNYQIFNLWDNPERLLHANLRQSMIGSVTTCIGTMILPKKIAVTVPYLSHPDLKSLVLDLFFEQ